MGIGSGLDVEGIIKQLTSLEKRPLMLLQGKVAEINTRMSTVGQIKAQVAALADSARKLSLATSWSGVTISSSSSTHVSGTATSAATPTSFSVEVQQLARAQSTSSTAVATGATGLGTGSFSIQLGTWSTAVPPVFTPGAAAAVNVSIGAGEDTLASIVSKINGANAGVTATVLRDATGERLLVRSNATGEATGFRMQVTGDSGGTDTDDTGLSRFAFDPNTAPAYGMAANAYQKGLNTQATINGIAVTSANSQLVDAIPGVTLDLLSLTTGPVTMTVGADTAAMKKSVMDFMASYNSLSKTLADATKYDDATKTPGVMQGDTVMVGLQNALRGLMGSSSVGGTFARLADVGLDMQRGGMLILNSTKFDAAMKDLPNLQKLFTADNSNAQTNGFGLKVKAFADGLLATGGTVSNKTNALESALKRNSEEQNRVNKRAAQVESQLRRQYSALDAQMGSLTALGAYVNQQVSMWNKSGG
jgi:flagellar hook-associated protein 2